MYTRGKNAEEGPSEPTVKFNGNEILLDSPNEPWEKDGWTLCPLSSLSVSVTAFSQVSLHLFFSRS